MGRALPELDRGQHERLRRDPDARQVTLTGSQAADAAARHSYGRLVAWLAWQWRDIAAAEDALADAFASALERWPVDGVPASPEGWLMTAARRRLLMAARRQRLEQDPTLTVLWPDETEPAPELPVVGDDRLRLMFVCAHPAIDPGVRSALMLQTVLGLDARRIACAFLVKPEAMTKRLVRAKAKIKSTGIRFEEPEAADLPQRLAAVLEAIYGAYTLHWGQSEEDGASDLAGEAHYLAEYVASQLPHEPEALGLAALIALCEARRPARLDAAGAFVPLDRQDTGRWDAALIARAHEWLARAAARRQPGPYQLEAAIQAAHVQGAFAGAAPWADIVRLYERLLAHSATVGARIGHAVACAQSGNDPLAGIVLLDAIGGGEAVASHQPWWAARGHLLAQAGRHVEAQQAYGRALALTSEPALRSWLTSALERQSALAAR
jgi:RNA polymerase sigma-70 factor (ECF subfamily)